MANNHVLGVVLLLALQAAALRGPLGDAAVEALEHISVGRADAALFPAAGILTFLGVNGLGAQAEQEPLVNRDQWSQAHHNVGRLPRALDASGVD